MIPELFEFLKVKIFKTINVVLKQKKDKVYIILRTNELISSDKLYSLYVGKNLRCKANICR